MHLFHRVQASIDELLCVPLPQKLVIPSRKLGLLLRFLQIVLVAVLIALIFVNDTWSKGYRPVAWAIELGQLPALDRSRVENRQTKHCQEPEAFFFRAFHMKVTPTYCQPVHEPLVAGDSSSSIYIPTMVHEKSNWRGKDSMCS